MPSKNNVLILVTLASFALSCGKDNKTTTPSSDALINSDNLSSSNILAPFDPSFESVETSSNPRRLPELNARFFRVKKSGNRNNGRSRNQSQILTGVSFTGEKSLQLFNAQNQSIAFPLDTERKGRPLNLIPGARYRVSAKVKLPRGNRFGSFSAEFTAILYSEDRRISNETVGKSYNWPQDGSWIEVTEEFETPSLTQNGSFNLSFNGSSDVIVDDLILVRIR